MNPDRIKLAMKNVWFQTSTHNCKFIHHTLKKKTLRRVVNSAVKKFLSDRLIINSRRLWNSHQRHKFWKAEATRDILKLRVSEMPFPGVLKRQFPPWMPCCCVRIHARLRTMPLKCSRCSMTLHGSNGQI